MTNELAPQGLDSRHWHGSCVIALVVLLVGLIPAAAMAAGESAGSGWTPQGEGASAPESGATPVQQGSSLGSGAGSQPTGSTTEAPVTGTGSSDYVEPSTPTYTEESSSEYTEAPSAPVVEAEAASPAAVATPAEEPSTTKAANAAAGVGAGVPIARSVTPPATTVDTAPAPAPVASPPEEVADSPSVPMWLLALGAVLILAWIGRAIVVAYRRRHDERPTPEPDWRPEAGEWEAVLEQIQSERSVGGKVRPLRSVDGEPDFGLAVADEDKRVAG